MYDDDEDDDGDDDYSDGVDENADDGDDEYDDDDDDFVVASVHALAVYTSTLHLKVSSSILIVNYMCIYRFQDTSQE